MLLLWHGAGEVRPPNKRPIAEIIEDVPDDEEVIYHITPPPVYKLESVIIEYKTNDE